MFIRTIILCMMIAGFGSARCVWADSIGYIDVQKVFLSYNETKGAQENLSKKEEKYKKEYESRQTKIDEAKKKNVGEKELENLIKKLEEELKPDKEALLKLNSELTVRLQNEIVKAVNEVAKELGVDMILDKQVIIIGGTDISDLVIAKLNKAKK